MTVLLLVIGFTIIGFMQIPSLVRKRWWKELICFGVLWLSGLILSIMLAIEINLPPISTILTELLTKIFGIGIIHF